MDLFRSGLKTVLGTQTAQNAGHQADVNSGAETVEKLVERLQTSTLLDDRRDACRAMRALSKKYRVEVGAQGMDAILNVLNVDRIDSEIVAYCLETLQNITSPELLDDEDSAVAHIGEQFTEIFTKKSENVSILLSVLEEYDFRIRLPLIRTMTNLLINRPKDMQEHLLVSPMGISKLMDLLSDSREVVRNEAILLLVALAKGNANIQKIIAFENGFDRTFQIIQDEGYSDGGPVVEDCLQLLILLLRNNHSNLTFFREGSYIKRLVPYYGLPSNSELDEGWPTQKVSNLYHMLQILRTLVNPLNPTHVTLSCQKVIKNCTILESLCNMLMATGIPAETLTEVIVSVGESMRGCAENQNYFGQVVAPSSPPRSALIILLMTLINERQPLSLRCAVIYCIQCYLYRNEKAQEEIVKTLLPKPPTTDEEPSPAPGVTPGILLCNGLFSKDISTNWFASITLAHTLNDSLAQKEASLKVQFATKSNNPPVTLLNHILNTIQQNVKPQIKIGLLQYLSIWLESCPSALTQFLSNKNSIPYLISQITSIESDEKDLLVQGLCAFVMGLCLIFNQNNVENFTKENLYQLITNRIGSEKLTGGLNIISKSEFYLLSQKHPQLIAKHSSDLIFDNTFCSLFKRLEPQILLQLNDPSAVMLPNAHHSTSSNISNSTSGDFSSSHQTPNIILLRYKEVIRTQDIALESCKAENSELKLENAKYKEQLSEMGAEIFQLRSQLALIQATNESFNHKSKAEEELSRLLQEKDWKIRELELKVGSLEKFGAGTLDASPPLKNSMHEELISKLEEENKLLLEEVERVKREQDEENKDLLELLENQEARVLKYKNRLKQLGALEIDDEDEDDVDDIEDEVEVEADKNEEENITPANIPATTPAPVPAAKENENENVFLQNQQQHPSLPFLNTFNGGDGGGSNNNGANFFTNININNNDNNNKEGREVQFGEYFLQ